MVASHEAAKCLLFQHSLVEVSTTNETKKKKKSKKQRNPVPEPFPAGANQALQDSLRLEVERFLDLAGEREFIVANALERLKSQNDALERLRAVDGIEKIPSGTASKRWITPKESGYHSDSESVSTTATQEERVSSDKATTTASLFLRGRAQERVLLQARDAISRAATLCQILNDPQNPGSSERKDVLIRAFRAITMDMS